MKKLKNGNMVNMKKRQNWTQFITIEKRVYSKLSKIESCKKMKVCKNQKRLKVQKISKQCIGSAQSILTIHFHTEL